MYKEKFCLLIKSQMSIINKYYVDEKWVLLKYDLNNYQKSDRGTPRWG